MERETLQEAEIDLTKEEKSRNTLQTTYTVITIFLIVAFFASTIYVGISCFCS